MAMKRKFTKGDKTMFQGKEFVVCEGGMTDPESKSYLYKISRGAWKRLVAGNRLQPA